MSYRYLSIRISVGEEVRRNPKDASAHIRRTLGDRLPRLVADGRFCYAGPAEAGDLGRGVFASLLVDTDESARLRQYQDDAAVPIHKVLPNHRIAPLSVWTPDMQGGGTFGDRTRALSALQAPRTSRPSGMGGAGVNVAVVDFGINDAWLTRFRGGTGLAGGWHKVLDQAARRYTKFGSTVRSDHAHMIVRNILSVAPDARIFDVPLLPDTTLGPPGVMDAYAFLQRIAKEVRAGKQDAIAGVEDARSLPDGPWILCNAWGLLDPFDQGFDPQHAFMEYWNRRDHVLIKLMEYLSAAGIDVVFAAGNCGQPGAHPRCAETASGPGFSIHGANASAAVLTVGAARVDGLPIGGSATGPGIFGIAAGPGASEDDSWYAKPDLVAPSYFRDDDNASKVNTGTSAACGLAVGVMAVLRGMELGKQQPHLSPPEMRALLRRTAQRAQGARWNPRLGWGMLNLREAAKSLMPSEDLSA